MILLHLAVLVLSGPDLIVNEIMFAPSPGGSEFVEVWNTSGRPVSLAGWSLADARQQPVALPSTVTIQAGGFAVLVDDGASFAGSFPGVPYIQVSPWPALNNDSDRVGLINPVGERRDVPYLASWGEPGRSIERRDPSGPSNHVVNWMASTHSSGATPGAVNTRYEVDTAPPILLMADWLPSGDVRAEFDEPVERLPANAASIDGRRASGVHWSADQYAADFTFTGGSMDATLSIESVADLFGNVASGLSAPVARPPVAGDIVVSEVLLDPLQDPFDGLPDQFSFVELLNQSSGWLSLRDHALAAARREDGLERRTPISFSRTALAPGARTVLVASPDDSTGPLVAAFPTLESIDVHTVSPWPVGRSEGTVRLVAGPSDVANATVSASWHDPVLGLPRGRSLERVDPWSESIGPVAWSSSTSQLGASPGTPAKTETAPRGRRLAPGDAVINEILFAPSSDQIEFVEIASVAHDSVDLHGSWLQIGSDSVRLGFQPTDWRPDAYAVAAVGHSDPAPTLRASFPGASIAWPLPAPTPASLRNDGDVVVLRSAEGGVVDSVRYDPAWHHPGVHVSRGRSLERIDPWGSSDSALNWTTSLDASGASPGRANTVRITGAAPAVSSALSIEPHVFDPDAGVFARISSRTVSPPGLATIQVFDLAGRLVRTLADRSAIFDRASAVWDGRDDDQRAARAGVYVVYARLRSESGRVHDERATVVLARRPG